VFLSGYPIWLFVFLEGEPWPWLLLYGLYPAFDRLESLAYPKS